MPLLSQLIHQHFDADTLARGHEYAKNDHVLNVKLRDGKLRSVVSGTDDYDVTIELRGLNIGHEGIAADSFSHHCTCPMGGDCKHVIATLIVWALDRGFILNMNPPAATNGPVSTVQATPEVDPFAHLLTQAWHGSNEQVHWMNRIIAHHDAPTKSPETQMVWVLTPVADSGIRVKVLLCRILKNGRLSGGKKFHSIDQFLTRSGTPVEPAARAILAAIHGESRLMSSWMADCLSSADLLQRVIATGYAVWEEATEAPAKLLPARIGLVTWLQKNGKIRLSVNDEHGEPLEILPTTPPWFRSGNGAGPLTSTIRPQVLARITTMPWLDPAMASAIVSSLPPEIPPPPLAPAILTPEPWLHHSRTTLAFWSRNLPGTNRIEADVAVVGFRYGNDEVGEGGSALLKRPDGSVLVRNLAAEKARIAELERLGLVTWPPPEFTPVSTQRGIGLRQRTVRGIGKADEKISGNSDEKSLFVIPPSTLAALMGSGWLIRGADVSQVAVHDLGAVSARVEDHEDGGWFELHLGIDVGGLRIDLVPLLTPLLRGGPEEWKKLPRASGEPPAVLATCGDNAVVRVPLDLLADLHAKLVELFDAPPGPGGGWRIDPQRADLLDALDRLSPRWIGAEKLRALAKQMASCLVPPAVAAPAGLTATLRPYQLNGLAWMRRLRELNIGGILADDMGLGKTIQAIAHLIIEHAASTCDRASLVVCPASVVGVWHGELTKFAPQLAVTVLHGAGRQRVTGDERGIVITSYATLARDIEAFASARWQVTIADEAQSFKNTGTAINAAMRRLNAHQRLCLTGTPVENHLGELHALLNWAAPGVLGGGTAFARTFRTPIEDAGDRNRADLLRRRTAPFLLRRTKAAVANDLPPRTDIDLPVELGPTQRRLYEAIRLTMDDRVRDAVAKSGLARSGLTVLEALLRLRQVCCDPRLLPEKLAGNVTDSAKLEALSELLTTLVEEKRQILVFSQFTSLLDLVEKEVLTPAGITALRLDGKSRNRADLVKRFQAGEAPIFLLSLKAGGTGLTLTAADTVVLLDPWWNPAVERQAADRAHRIGQNRPVTIYRLVAANTVESRIRTLQANKSALADALMDDSGQSLGKLDLADIEALLAPVDASG
jgi:superfamily II DNA or RNA helicase